MRPRHAGHSESRHQNAPAERVNDFETLAGRI
jgi:hypothetical protein